MFKKAVTKSVEIMGDRSCRRLSWVVQAQTRSVGVWSVGLAGRPVAGRSVSCYPSLSLHPTSAAQPRLFIHAQISLCNYTLPPLPSLSLILRKRRITSISQHHFHNQRVCCDQQFTDRCSERESPTRPRSSPLRLDPQASPDGAPRRPLHPATSLSTPRS